MIPEEAKKRSSLIKAEQVWGFMFRKECQMADYKSGCFKPPKMPMSVKLKPRGVIKLIKEGR